MNPRCFSQTYIQRAIANYRKWMDLEKVKRGSRRTKISCSRSRVDHASNFMSALGRDVAGRCKGGRRERGHLLVPKVPKGSLPFHAQNRQ